MLGIHVDLHAAWPVLVAAVPVGLLLIGAVNAWLSARNERRRTQPAVICQERHARTFTRDALAWVISVAATNEGGGPAFNVRVGVQVRALRFPWRRRRFPWREDRREGGASRHRVLRPGGRLPPGKVGSLPIYIPSTDLAALVVAHKWRPRRRGTIDDGRVYWCRYENAHGQTWETRNPFEPTAHLRIRRIRLPRLREWTEEWRGRRLRAAGLALDAQLARGLIQEAKAAQAAPLAALTGAPSATSQASAEVQPRPADE